MCVLVLEVTILEIVMQVSRIFHTVRAELADRQVGCHIQCVSIIMRGILSLQCMNNRSVKEGDNNNWLSGKAI